MFALQDISKSLFDSGLPLNYRGAVEQDVNQEFAQQALKMAESSDIPVPLDVKSILEAIASSDASRLTVRCPAPAPDFALITRLTPTIHRLFTGVGTDYSSKESADAVAGHFTFGAQAI